MPPPTSDGGWFEERGLERPTRRGAVWLGVTVVVMVVALLGALGVFGSSPTTTTTPSTVSPLALRERAACAADARTVETAAYAWDADPPTHCTSATCTIGLVPTSGPGSITIGDPSTYANSAPARLLITGQFLNYWPTNSAYAISFAAAGQGTAGEAIIYVPATSTHGVAYDSEGPDTGCNSIGRSAAMTV